MTIKYEMNKEKKNDKTEENIRQGGAEAVGRHARWKRERENQMKIYTGTGGKTI